MSKFGGLGVRHGMVLDRRHFTLALGNKSPVRTIHPCLAASRNKLVFSGKYYIEAEVVVVQLSIAWVQHTCSYLNEEIAGIEYYAKVQV